ncbi:MAG: protoglobin domain-containing protein [Janthinobacterium lividum]
MTSPHDPAHQSRFQAFSIREQDLETLKSFQGYTEQKLPNLLVKLHPSFSELPEIQTVLMDPVVHEIRLAHWQRVASGRFGAGFTESAKRLGIALHERNTPAYAVTLCHSIVLNGILHDLLLDRPCTRLTSFKASTSKHSRRIALQKAAWLDLEVLLETYAAAEKDSRSLGPVSS